MFAGCAMHRNQKYFDLPRAINNKDWESGTHMITKFWHKKSLYG